MASLEYFLVAEDVSIDQVTNQLSLFNVFEGFRTPRFPLIVPKCAAVSLWRKEPADEGRDFQCVLRVTLPDGQNHQSESNFRMTNERQRIVTRLQGVPISMAGELRFELLLNGQHAASHLVIIEHQPPEDAPAITH
jgi:hypothetical protein